MTRLIARTCVAATLLLAFTAGWAAEHEVKMLNNGADGTMVFEPGYLKVTPGDTVHFIPADPAHNSASSLVPEGGNTWQGELSKKVSVTLNQEGIYIYQCDPHLALGMVGVIQVGAPKNLEQAKQKAASMKTGMAMNKDRLEQYLDQVK